MTCKATKNREIHFNDNICIYNNSKDVQKILKQLSENCQYMKAHPSKFTYYERMHPPSDRSLEKSRR